MSLMYCGVPIGAALAAALGFSGLASARQTVFWVGGVIPLLLVPLLMRWLPESQVYTQQTQVAAAPRAPCLRQPPRQPRCCCGCAISSPCWWCIC